MRLGNFTSSGISALMKNGRKKGEAGAGFYTYVKEKRRERKLGRSMAKDATGASLDWGNLCESIANDHISVDYKLVSQQRYKHDSLPWSGMPDGLKGSDVVTDIKCPWTMTSFMDMVECKTGEDLKAVKPEYYWQLISNAILTKRYSCELIVFMPKLCMLEEIKTASKEQGYFFHMKDDGALPWLPDDCEINVITKIKFEASVEDCNALTERVEMAAKLLEE
jgi:hypothetical protein